MGNAFGVGDANEAVAYDSGWYVGGEAVGTAQSTLIGGGVGDWAEGLSGLARGMSRSNSIFPKGVEWVEQSHWIPDRFKWVPSAFKNSRWNQKLMWGIDHAKNDAWRWRFLPKSYKALNDMNDPLFQQLNRMPGWAQGGLMGFIYGASSHCVESSNH